MAVRFYFDLMFLLHNAVDRQKSIIMIIIIKSLIVKSKQLFNFKQRINQTPLFVKLNLQQNIFTQVFTITISFIIPSKPTIYIMSLFTLGGIDLSFCSVLRQQMTVLSFINLKEHGCIKCSSRKLEKFVWVNDASVDVNFICRNCANKHKEEGICIQREVVMQVLQALNGAGIEKESNALIQVLFKMLRSNVKIRGMQKDRAIDSIKSELVGWTYNQAQDTEEKSQHKLGTLLRQFMQDLRSSFPAKLYSALRRSPFKLQSGFIPLFKRVIREQKAFKLDVLKRMIASLKSATQADDIFKWMRRGLVGIKNFQYSFGITPSNQQRVIYSICRSYAQFRSIYEENTQGIQKPIDGQMLLGLVPFLNECIYFKLMTFGSIDEIDIGVYFGKKSADELTRGHSPILFRFLIEPKPIKRHLRSFSLPSQHRIRLIQTIKVESPKTQRGSTRQLFLAMDEDEISLYFDYTKQTFRLFNQTQNFEYISMPMKYLSRQSYVYPCVRLVGVKVMVQFMDSAV